MVRGMPESREVVEQIGEGGGQMVAEEVLPDDAHLCPRSDLPTHPVSMVRRVRARPAWAMRQASSRLHGDAKMSPTSYVARPGLIMCRSPRCAAALRISERR
jgi:hypothetical protein